MQQVSEPPYPHSFLTVQTQSLLSLAKKRQRQVLGAPTCQVEPSLGCPSLELPECSLAEAGDTINASSPLGRRVPAPSLNQTAALHVVGFIYWPEVSLSLTLLPVWKPFETNLLQMWKLRALHTRSLESRYQTGCTRFPSRPSPLLSRHVPAAGFTPNWLLGALPWPDHQFEYLTFPCQGALFLRTKPFPKLLLQI